MRHRQRRRCEYADPNASGMAAHALEEIDIPAILDWRLE